MRNSAANEILVGDPEFYVVLRGRSFGPFDYDWSTDLRGVRLTYCGQQFGEICGEDRFFADLSEFELPSVVRKVAVIASSTLLPGLSEGTSKKQRLQQLADRLRQFDFQGFRIRERIRPEH